jgi:hypothetical protein
MKLSTLIISIIALVAIVAFLTNPKPERHKEVVKNKIYQYWQKIMLEDVSNARNRREEVAQELEILLGSTLVDKVIDNVVSSEDYLLFSTTKISFDGKSKTIGYGVFGNVYLDKELDEGLNEIINKTNSEDLNIRP